MDALKDILRKVPYLILCLAYAAKLGYDYYSFMNDPASPLIQKQGQITQAQSRVEGLQTKLKQANEFFNSLERKRTEMRALAVELSEMKVSFTDELDVPAFIKQVATEAKLVRLRVSSIQPNKVLRESYYAKHVFDLDYSGAYVQLLAFMQRLSSVPNIVRIEGFQVKTRGDASRKVVEIDGRLRIAAFTYAGSAADDKAKELSAPKAQPQDAGKAGRAATKGGA